MRKFRFNIASLLGVILVLGVAFAALRESDDLWESGLFTLTLGVLLVSILLAVRRSEANRAFWLGFALLGWGYLALSLVPTIESRLLTTKGLAYLDSKVPRRSSSAVTLMLSGTHPGGYANSIQIATSNQHPVRLSDAATGRVLVGWIGTRESFVRIGHSLFALLAGWLGGQLSRRLYRASRTPDVRPAEGPAG
jgi:hypothetical protein